MSDTAVTAMASTTSSSQQQQRAGHDRRRVLIFNVTPVVDGGAFPVKRVIGDRVDVEVDLVCDGHDQLTGRVLYRRVPNATAAGEPAAWHSETLQLSVNDRYRASFEVDALGIWEFTVDAWVDEFASWLWGFQRKVAAREQPAELKLELQRASALVEAARGRAERADIPLLDRATAALGDPSDMDACVAVLQQAPLRELMAQLADRTQASGCERAFQIEVERERAGFSAWYELFPRSFGEAGQHGTFKDVERMLGYVADLGFDVLYLPPIHPIGEAFRKGPNNSLQAGPADPGSPWAIGGRAGGHKQIHPQLGSVDEFRSLVASARKAGLEIALDIAFQASPDHPYVREHPEWFVQRPDGSIQYAENPPKKYQDVYPFDLAGPDSESLWHELRDVFQTWVDLGVKIFRVDNPHTKPLRFWQWCISELKKKDPELIFLAEAFTRPKLMYALAKLGFTQSYTYFTWRTSAWELREYLTELTRTEVKEFFRPNFWPNTPDILPEHLQHGGRPMFIQRAVLASTLSSNYGIYGPAFELLQHEARPGSEEYIDNEKYQLRQWNLEDPESLAPVIKRLNAIRKENPALRRTNNVVFHRCENEALLVYSKADASGRNVILVAINLDPRNEQSSWVDLDLAALGLQPDETFQVHDLLSDARYIWHGARAYVRLQPWVMPAHVFVIRRRSHSEQDFEYFQ